MQALSHSAFLQALGYAIINSLWQMALLWIVVVLLNSIVALSSNMRYKIALGAQFAGFTWFVVTLQYYFVKCAASINEIKEYALSNQSEFIQTQASNFNTKLWATMIKTEQLLPYLSIAYMLLLLFLVVKWVRGYKNTQLIRTEGLQKIDADWKIFVQRTSDYLGIKRKIKIFASSIVKSPLTIGFLKPVILIPVASLNHLSVKQLEAVILHELAHIKRADYLINLVQCIIEIALFFNPFSQLISKFIKKERENSCDDWVLQFQYNPTMYAEALLQLAYLNAGPSLAMSATGHSKGDLLSRVRRMLNQKEKTFTYKHQLFAFLLMTFILSSIAWFDPSSTTQATASQPSSAVKKPIVAEPVMANADNPLFNPVSFLNSGLKEEMQKVTESIQAHTAEITTKSISAAHEALKRAVPAALETVRNMDFTSIPGVPNADKIQPELDKAYEEISKINFENLIDTLTINSSIRNEFAKAKIELDKEKVNVDLSKINAQLSGLDFLKYIPAEEREKIKKSLRQAMKDVQKSTNIKFDWKQQQQQPDVPVPAVAAPAAPAAPSPVPAAAVKRVPAVITITSSNNSTTRPLKGTRFRLTTSPKQRVKLSTTHTISNGQNVIISSDDVTTEKDAPDEVQSIDITAPSDDNEEDDKDLTMGRGSSVKGITANNYVANSPVYSTAYTTAYNAAPATYNLNTNTFKFNTNTFKAFENLHAENFTNAQKLKLFKLTQLLRAVKHYNIVEKQSCTSCTDNKKEVVVEIVVYQ